MRGTGQRFCLKSQGVTMPPCWRRLDQVKKIPGGQGCYLWKWVRESPHSAMERGGCSPGLSQLVTAAAFICISHESLYLLLTVRLSE